jgi:hypothetical protein
MVILFLQCVPPHTGHICIIPLLTLFEKSILNIWDKFVVNRSKSITYQSLLETNSSMFPSR